MTVHLFLSPHLDDAVFSCGGTIRHLTNSKNAQVVVMTVMAGDPPDPLPDSPLIRELHARWEAGEHPAQARREEDIAAMKLLGAEYIHLMIPDCVYRTAEGKVLYPHGDEDIFGNVHQDDPAIKAMDMLALPYELTETVFYAPLGLGHHVDHLLVRDWILRLTNYKATAGVYFYEDYPYAEDAVAVQRGMNEFPHELEAAPQTLTEEDFEQKLNAAACYRSQISTFWQNLDEMRQHFHAYNTRSGTLEEKFWSIIS